MRTSSAADGRPSDPFDRAAISSQRPVETQKLLQKFLPSSTPGVEGWREDLWRKSHSGGRRDGEVSRLYDELIRLEEAETSLHNSRLLGGTGRGKADRNNVPSAGRRRVSSLGAPTRKTRTR